MNLEKPSCYVASPYGFAESTRVWYNETFLPLLDKHVTIIDPWSVDTSHILAATPDKQPELWIKLGEHHFKTIATRAKLIVAGLDQEPPDNGTVGEVCWAAAHDIPVIGYRGDLRTTGEEGMPYNLMVSAAIRVSGGLAVATLTELDAAVEQYAAQISLG